MIYIILAIIAIALFTLFSVTLVSHLFAFVFLYIDYNVGRLRTPTLYPAVSLFRFLINFCSEFYYLCGKYYLLPYKFRDLTLNFQDNTANGTAVLLIHGYARNQTDWLWFMKKIAVLGCPIFTINLKPSLGSIQQIAGNCLTERIKEIKQATQCKNLILIGHSMGGLVASYYAEFLDKEGLINTIITIGTPYSGTKISLVASGDNAKQMNPLNKFTDDLRDKIASSSRQYYQIATRMDNIIFPWRSQILDSSPATHQLILTDESHLGMLHSKQVIKQILDWLGVIAK